MTRTYPFTEEQATAAHEEWGANCGPTALAFALGVGLDYVRESIPGFEEKRYTSPSMMKSALRNLAQEFFAAPTGLSTGLANMFADNIALVRVQWSGPWTQPGANPKWAYRQTHWIATWLEPHGQFGETHLKLIFDVNGGIRPLLSWEEEIVPLILKSYPRADGGWFPTHIWRIE